MDAAAVAGFEAAEVVAEASVEAAECRGPVAGCPDQVVEYLDPEGECRDQAAESLGLVAGFLVPAAHGPELEARLPIVGQEVAGRAWVMRIVRPPDLGPVRVSVLADPVRQLDPAVAVASRTDLRLYPVIDPAIDLVQASETGLPPYPAPAPAAGSVLARELAPAMGLDHDREQGLALEPVPALEFLNCQPPDCQA